MKQSTILLIQIIIRMDLLKYMLIQMLLATGASLFILQMLLPAIMQ